MAQQSAMQTIADEARMPATKGQSNTSMLQGIDSGLTAKGSALAETVLHQAERTAAQWTPFYKDLLKLDPNYGRPAFVKLIKERTQRPDQVDVDGNKVIGNKGKVVKVQYDETATAQRRSARVRLSEFLRICKALDAGINFDPTWSFNYAQGHAHTALKAKATPGQTTRGRPATSAADKMKAYIAKHLADVGGVDAVELILGELATELEKQA